MANSATFGARLRTLRLEHGLSMDALGRALGISKSSINMYEHNGREPSFETLETIADYFNVDMDYLLGKSEHRNKTAWLQQMNHMGANLYPVEVRQYPVLGEIACGEPRFADEQAAMYTVAGSGVQADFCLIARGDSMTGARIYDGDIVFVRQQEMVDDGEIAAVLIGDEATLKRVYYDREHNEIMLYAENPNYRVLRYAGPELEQIRILGKAVAFQSTVR